MNYCIFAEHCQKALFQKMEDKRLYVKVIVPLRFRESVTYSVPEGLAEKVKAGSRVDILLANKPYKAIVREISDSTDFDPAKIKDICGVDGTREVSSEEIALWESMADYYMCTPGEVLKAAAPVLMEDPKRRKAAKEKKPQKKGEKQEAEAPVLPYLNLKILTPPQQEALDKIKLSHRKGRIALLNGVHCSGKGEIYIHLVKECLEKGKNALVLVPEIASAKEDIDRFREIFGDRLAIYHNDLTLPKKKLAVDVIKSTSCNSPAVVISTRQGIFLPLGNLGLVVVDNEHDAAYKQPDPAPRYNGRDAAMLLAKAKGANVVLGSATPSFESLYNAAGGKYDQVLLTQRHPGCQGTKITVIDSTAEKKKKAVIGSYTTIAAKAVAQAVKEGKEIVVFKPRRAFSKDDDLAAEIITLFHDSGIGLYSDINELEAIGRRPSMIVVLQGEALLNSQDFRADEKAFQSISRLSGILGRGEQEGHLIIQTSQPKNNVFKALSDPGIITKLIKEREEFGFPPFKRMVQITLKDTFPDRLERKGAILSKKIAEAGIEDFSGPTPPPFEKIPNGHSLIFRIQLKRDRQMEPLKRKLLSILGANADLGASIDVDPL